MRTLAALAVLLLVTACTTAPPEGLTDADRAAVNRVVADYAASALAGDWAALGALWTPDAAYLVPEAPAIRGRDAIVATFQGSPPPTEAGVDVDAWDGTGNWAWVRGTWHWVTPATEEAPEMRGEGSFLWVMEKQPNGTWLIDTECFNSDAPRDMPAEG
jgi:ketosteroid isomerase-like protein